METTGPPRPVGGALLPAAGSWRIDPDHSEVSFTGRHLMLTRVRGRFTDVAGTITIAEDIEDSAVHVAIGMASVCSGSKERDDRLRSSDFFDVETFALATFRSRRIEWQRAGGVVHGELTIRGITRQVPLEVLFEGRVRDPRDGDRATFSAVTRLNREDFGMAWNGPGEAGGLLVSKEITITIEIETLRVS